MLSTPAADAVMLHYQPMADCRGEVVGFEALMRWHHQDRGAISAEAFIPIFEQSGLIVPLSRWALHQACLDAASWGRPLSVAVNLSISQFRQEDLPALVRSALLETGLPAGRLELEVAETALLAEPHSTLKALSELRDQGVAIALDEFGSDGSKPTHLKHYPFSKVKLDRSFVGSIESSASARSIIHMIIELAHSLHLTVTAAGVETDGQLAYLRQQGCDHVQGYLIGRPAMIESFGALTGGNRRPSAADSGGERRPAAGAGDWRRRA